MISGFLRDSIFSRKAAKTQRREWGVLILKVSRDLRSAIKVMTMNISDHSLRKSRQETV